MYWDGITFLGFIAMSLLGGAAAYFILRMGRKRPTDASNAKDGAAPVLGLSRTIGLIATGLAFAGAISAVVSLLPSFFTPRTLGPGSNPLSQVPWSMVTAYVAMLAGMAASYLNKLIEQRRAKIAQLRANGSLAEPGLDFDVWDFVQPFLVSLITFGALVARTATADTLTSILLGFETGFFWQSVLAGRVQPRGTQPDEKPPHAPAK